MCASVPPTSPDCLQLSMPSCCLPFYQFERAWCEAAATQGCACSGRSSCTNVYHVWNCKDCCTCRQTLLYQFCKPASQFTVLRRFSNNAVRGQQAHWGHSVSYPRPTFQIWTRQKGPTHLLEAPQKLATPRGTAIIHTHSQSIESIDRTALSSCLTVFYEENMHQGHARACLKRARIFTGRVGASQTSPAVSGPA